MNNTYFMQDQVNPAAKIQSITNWVPTKISYKAEAAAHFEDIAVRRIAPYGIPTKQGETTSVRPLYLRPAYMMAAQLMLPQLLGETVRASEWDQQFINNAHSRLKEGLEISDKQAAKLSELHKKYSGGAPK